MSFDVWEAIWNQRSRYADLLSERLNRIQPKFITSMKARAEDEALTRQYSDLQRREKENRKRMQKLLARTRH